MKQTKDCVVTIRVIPEIKEKIDLESEQQQVSLNTLISKILTKHLEWDKFAKETGFLPIPKLFLVALLKQVDNEIIESLTSTVCTKSVKDSIQYMHNFMNLETLTRTLDQWLEASSITYRHNVKDDLNRYVIRHELGRKWGLHFVSLASTLLREIGYLPKNIVTDNELVSFDIMKLD